MDDLIESRRTLDNFIAAPNTREVILQGCDIMAESINHGGKVIAAGNGGSMCDAMHFAEELTGRYRLNRPSLPAISICDPCHITCVGNDYGFDFIFSRFLEGMGQEGDVFLGISTSGNSRNIIEACRVCKERKMKSICLLGKDGGKLKDMCDLPIIVPHDGFADRIQEVHTTIIHIFIRALEQLLTSAQMGQR
ncbi:MAG TPA: D-sedoheptulose 7-phosphate isomerase [Candidatus Anaerobiospirillum stercoravium]|nr:D-sedoheptulose 7-phosphate isomerase [Candidatus Anaerobiospirillum stercoravium]